MKTQYVVRVGKGEQEVEEVVKPTCSNYTWEQSRTTSPKWTWTALYFSVKIPSMSVQVVYHHNLDGPDSHKDEVFTEKYGAVQVHFGKIVCCGRNR